VAENDDKENVNPSVSTTATVEEKKPRYVCRVVRRAVGDVLRLRACDGLDR
jgi:hypothetical protein